MIEGVGRAIRNGCDDMGSGGMSAVPRFAVGPSIIYFSFTARKGFIATNHTGTLVAIIRSRGDAAGAVLASYLTLLRVFFTSLAYYIYPGHGKSPLPPWLLPRRVLIEHARSFAG